MTTVRRKNSLSGPSSSTSVDKPVGIKSSKELIKELLGLRSAFAGEEEPF